MRAPGEPSPLPGQIRFYPSDLLPPDGEAHAANLPFFWITGAGERPPARLFVEFSDEDGDAQSAAVVMTQEGWEEIPSEWDREAGQVVVDLPPHAIGVTVIAR